MAGSFRTVSLGMKEGLEELGLLAGFVQGESTEFELEEPGATAPVAIVVGDPMRVLQTHVHGLHTKTWLLLAPNSNGIPPKLRDELLGDVFSPSKQKRVPVVDGLLAPSTWAQQVLQRDFPDKPVVLCPHGILSDFRFRPLWSERRAADKKFTGLHVTSSRLSRKGTTELVEAWMRMDDKSELHILANPQHRALIGRMVQEKGAEKRVFVFPGQYEQSVYVRSLHIYSVVVQPSRAEGFGLVPLEARACGVPAVMTDNTGHLDQFDAGCCERVESGLDASSDDYWGATAPKVSVDAIHEALLRARGRMPTLVENAIKFARDPSEWSWANQIRTAMKNITKEHTK